MSLQLSGRDARPVVVTFVSSAFLVALVAGGGRSIAWVVLLAAALAASSAATLALARGRGGGDRAPSPLVLGASVVLLLVGALGLVPLPASLLQRLSPVRASLQAAVPPDLEAWRDAHGGMSISDILGAADSTPPAASGNTAGASGAGAPATFDPARTRYALVALAGFLALACMLSCAPDASLGLWCLSAMLAATALAALFGIANHHLDLGDAAALLAPRRPVGVGALPYATFVNVNHFAGLCAMLFPVALVLAADRARHVAIRAACGLAVLALAAGVVDAGSRGGLIAGGVAAVALGAFLALHPGRRLAGAALGLLAVTGLTLSFTVLADRVIHESFASTTSLSGSNFERMTLYRREARMLASAPLVGGGVGAFVVAQPAYKTTPEPLAPLHGESDWLEVLAEGGVPFALAWLVLVGALLAPPLRLCALGRADLLTCGLVAGSLGTLIHAAVDFHHREPSVALVSIVLATTAHAVARARAPAAVPASPSARRTSELLVGTLALVTLLGLLAGGHRWALGDVALRAADRARERGDVARLLVEAQSATRSWPALGDTHALLALAHEERGLAQRPGPLREHERDEALRECVAAIRCAPATVGAARRAGGILLARGALEKAEAAARLALAVAPGNAASHELMAQVLLARDRQLEALPHLAFALSATPPGQLPGQSQRLAMEMADASGGDAAAVLAALPDSNLRGWYLLALARLGRSDELASYFPLLVREASTMKDPDALAGVLGLTAAPERLDLARALLPRMQRAYPRSLAAQVLAQAGDDASAAPALREVLAGPDRPADAFSTLALIEQRAGHDGEARRLLEQGRAEHPEVTAFADALARLDAAKAPPP